MNGNHLATHPVSCREGKLRPRGRNVVELVFKQFHQFWVVRRLLETLFQPPEAEKNLNIKEAKSASH